MIYAIYEVLHTILRFDQIKDFNRIFFESLLDGDFKTETNNALFLPFLFPCLTDNILPDAPTTT